MVSGSSATSLVSAVRAERHGAVRPIAMAMLGIETGIVISTTTFTAYSWHRILQPFEQVYGFTSPVVPPFIH